jgi:hypothetical protein
LPESLLLPLIAAGAGAAWILGLRYLGVDTDPAVLAWRRLARLRGLADSRPLGVRVGERLPLLRRLQDETNVERLLAIAGSADTPSSWLLRTAAYAGTVLVAFFVLDEAVLSFEGHSGPPLVLGILAAAAVTAVSYGQLRSRALKQQRRLGRALADALPHVAVMTYHHRLPASEALLRVARSQHDRSLYDFLSGDAWRRLAEPRNPGSQATSDRYSSIGRAYDIPMFSALGGALQLVTERGLSSQEVLTRLARDTLSDRAAEARVAASQTKTMIVIPMGLMICPVLLLIGAPIIAGMAYLFAK